MNTLGTFLLGSSGLGTMLTFASTFKVPYSPPLLDRTVQAEYRGCCVPEQEPVNAGLSSTVPSPETVKLYV